MNYQNRKRSGLTVLELLGTLVILALVLSSVLQLLRHTEHHVEVIRSNLSARMSLNDSLNRMMDDIVRHGQDVANFSIERHEGIDYDTSRLTIEIGYTDPSNNRKLIRQIEWVAAPRIEPADLVLYRREKTSDNKVNTDFVPQCKGLSRFDVTLSDGWGDEDERPVERPENQSNRAEPKMIQVRAGLYLDEPSEDAREVFFDRTVALHRFIPEDESEISR